MIIKLDMANAVDRVKHYFLYKVLLSFGFSTNFFNLIKACIGKSWIDPLVNGITDSYFPTLEGNKERLSPLSFSLHSDGRFVE